LIIIIINVDKFIINVIFSNHQMPIKFIYGMSGCAKTTTAIKSLAHVKSFTCIAFTHSAVNNLKDMYRSIFKNVNDNYFMTIHKFLRIPINEDGSYTIVKHYKLDISKLILVDEFSLIPLDIIQYLFELSESTGSTFIFIGDFIQLMPISPIKQPIDLKLLKSDFSNIDMTFNEAIRIADHLSNSVYVNEYFIKADKLILTHNYRNNDNVHQILKNALDMKFNIIPNSLIQKYVNDGYVILSSMYEHLKHAYLMSNISEGILKNCKIGKIRIKVNDKMTLMENINSEFVNGDIVTVSNILDDNDVELDKNGLKLIINVNKLLPYNFITCHKAQGRTIPKVIVILDDLFEITMLYTAITRAKEDVKFVQFKQNLPKTFKDDLNAFKIMRDVIYKLNNK